VEQGRPRRCWPGRARVGRGWGGVGQGGPMSGAAGEAPARAEGGLGSGVAERRQPGWSGSGTAGRARVEVGRGRGGAGQAERVGRG
jgi:hypothetical protein